MYGDKFDGWGFCAVFCLNGLLLCAEGCIIVVGMEDRGWRAGIGGVNAGFWLNVVCMVCFGQRDMDRENEEDIMNWLRAYAEKIYRNLGQYFRWLLFGVVTGVAVGLFASLFSWCLIQVTSFRMGHRYMFLTLPLGGLLIVFTYKAFHFENNGGTDSVIESIHSEITIPFRMALLIFSSTIITILCGGSVGREGAALQIGGSIGKKLGDIFHFNVKDKKIILMSGMAAAFAALFGTPMAAAFFAMEVSSVGIMYYAALVPCICAALIAHKIAFSLGVQTENFHVMNDLELSLIPGLKVVLLAICCAILSILFCMMLQMGEALFKKYFSNLYIRIAAGGLLLILLTLICGSQDYLGTGMPVIEHALSGTAIPWAFFFKMLFTVITISAGYKGGEIVPSLFIGATFGCTLGALLGLPASLGAAVGMIAVFCGVTNCPVTSILIAFELFGFDDAYYFLIAVATSYMLSGYYSLYHSQTIVYSKFENKYVNQPTSHRF